MKTILYILIFNFSAIGFAQDPQLFENTWYLYEVLSTDMDDLKVVSEIDPPITPYLDISENLDFTGEGACNTFSGTYSFFPPENLTATDFTATTSDCGVQIHNSFEDSYFGFISGEFWYNISQDSEGSVLSMSNALMGYALFKSYPLSNPDFKANKLTVYPNPVTDKLYLQNLNNINEDLQIKIYDLTGKLLISTVLKTDISINVENLKTGVYFMVVGNEKGGFQTEKFIKM